MRALFLEEAARNAEARARNIEFQAAILALMQPGHSVPALQSVPQDARALFSASASGSSAPPLPLHAAALRSRPTSLPVLAAALPYGPGPLNLGGPGPALRAPASPHTPETLPGSSDVPETGPGPATLLAGLGSSPTSQMPSFSIGEPALRSCGLLGMPGTQAIYPAPQSVAFAPGSIQSTMSQPAPGPAMPIAPAFPPPQSVSLRYVPAATLLNARAISPGLVPLMPADILDPQWDKLVASFTEAALLRYQWKRHNRILIPEVSLADSGIARETWVEWTVGVNGGFSIQQLDAWFGASWKQNEGKLKTPYTKRKAVAELIDEIAKQRANWTPEIALRLLERDYAGYTAGTLYSKIITKPEKRKALLENALSATCP